MKELIAELIPYALAGFYTMVGVGGTVGYYRRNGNGKWNGQSERRSEPPVTIQNEPTVTLRECDLRHKGMERELKEGNRRMTGVETQMQKLNDTIIKHYEKT